MKITSLVAASTIVAATAVTALPAQADRIDNRQARQMERIEQGVRSGQLTRFEARKLIAQQHDIAKLERKFERDGRLTPAERQQLTMLQNRASRMIFQEKNDNETRRHVNNGRGWGWGHRFNERWGWGRDRHADNANNYDRPFYRRWWWN